MNDAFVACRARIGLIALIAAFAWPAGAQQRTLVEVDQTVAEQQATLDRLKASVEQLRLEQLKRENDALQRSLSETKNAKTAPAEAWTALGTVGLVFVLTWGIVTLVREWSRTREIETGAEERIRAGIDKQIKLIESAADARIQSVKDLLLATRNAPGPRPPVEGAP